MWVPWSWIAFRPSGPRSLRCAVYYSPQFLPIDGSVAGTGEQLSGPSSPQHLSPESSGGGVKTPSTPEPAEEGKSPQLDIYGRRLDRSFQTGEGAREPIADKECDTTIADVRSGDQHPRVESCAVTAAIVGRAERRVEASEAVVREAATAAVTAASEARAAKDETERLRAEGVELSRWREAVLNLRDVLEISQREGQRGGDDGREARSTNENGRCFQCWLEARLCRNRKIIDCHVA